MRLAVRVAERAAARAGAATVEVEAVEVTGMGWGSELGSRLVGAGKPELALGGGA